MDAGRLNVGAMVSIAKLDGPVRESAYNRRSLSGRLLPRVTQE
jgi:hypothetical protein